jgi:hypothetical protein
VQRRCAYEAQKGSSRGFGPIWHYASVLLPAQWAAGGAEKMQNPMTAAGIKVHAVTAPEQAATIQQNVSAVYVATIWLGSQFTMPLADFERFPFYIVFTGFMYLFLPIRAILCSFLLLVILVAYEVLKCVQADFAFTSKGVLGLIAFSCVMSTTHFALLTVQDCSATQLGRWLRVVILVMAAGMAVEIGLTGLGLSEPVYQNYILPLPAFSGLFTEPSHFALALSPFLFLVVNRPSVFRQYIGTRYLWLMAGMAVLCPSATLIAITALAACISFSANALRLRAGGIAAVLVLAVVLAFAIVVVPQISERVFGVLSVNAYDPLGEQNLSALLFEKGKQMAQYALLNFPLGVAFLNIVILAPEAPVSYLADAVFYMNSQDGSSILFKGVCEMGILFVLFSVVSFVSFFKRTTRVNSLSGLVVLSFQFAFFAHFIRAGSYFQGCLAIGLSACIFGLLELGPFRRFYNMGLGRSRSAGQARSAQAAFRV